jgi:ABC-type antimicrobial peptide transport system permease subunit
MAFDTRAAQAGQHLFLFSGRLVGFALTFALILGAIAGAYATARILRVSPAEAIRRGA